MKTEIQIIAPVFPSRFGASNSDEVPRDLIGATILRMGTVEKNGRPILLIEYSAPEGAKELSLSFNDAAIWIEDN